MKATIMRLAALAAPRTTTRWAARAFLTPHPVQPADDERDLLATATRGELVTDGEARLHAFVWGDEGPTVLLVHGWNGNVGQLARLVRPLRRAGFRVVAYSAPAHGASSGTTTHVPAMADAVAAMARRFGPLHAIVAHSVGATAVARAIQGGVAVERAVLVAPATGPRRWISRFAAAAGLPPRARAQLAAEVEERAGVALTELELEAIAPDVPVPVLAVHDRDDALVPAVAVRRAIRAMRDAELVETSGLGHFGILRDAAVLRDVVAFVTQSPARAALAS